MATPSQDAIRKAAATAYLAAVKPYNSSIDTLYKQYRYKTSLAANKQYCAKLATVTHAESVALNVIVYPTDTAGDAKVVSRSDASAEADLRSCAIAASIADWNRFWNLSSITNQHGHEAANLVRLDLGLPSVPG